MQSGQICCNKEKTKRYFRTNSDERIFYTMILNLTHTQAQTNRIQTERHHEIQEIKYKQTLSRRKEIKSRTMNVTKFGDDIPTIMQAFKKHCQSQQHALSYIS